MSHFRQRLQLFSNQPFRYLALSCLCANLGFGLNYVMMAWLILQPSGSVSAVAILMICSWAPLVFFGPLAGVLCDRYSRKKIIILGNLLRFGALIVFVLLAGPSFSNVSLYMLAAIIGLGTCFAGPPTMALTREVVPEKDLLSANVVVDIAYETGNIVGMGCAGLLLAVLSTKGVMTLNAMWFLVGAITILLMRHQHVAIEQKNTASVFGFVKDYQESLHYLWGKKDLCLLYTVQLLLMITFMTAPILLAPFAKNIMQATVTQFGQLEAALSVGIVLGGLLNPFFAEVFGIYRTMIFQILLLALSFFIFSRITYFSLGLSLYFVIGFCESVWPLVLTTAQELTDMDYQGRVFSTFMSFSGIAVLSIYLLVYFLSDSMSLRQMYWVEAAIAALAGLLLIWYRWGKVKKVLS